MNCPRCTEKLAVTFCTGGRMMMCAYCQGTAVTVEMLRRFAPKERIDDVWRQAMDGREKSELACPGCEAPLRRAAYEAPSQSVNLDACTHCHIVWFDAEELRAFSPGHTEPPTEEERHAVAERLGIKDRDDTHGELWRIAGALDRLFG